MSSNAELLICLGVLAALWIGYVIRQVRQERRRPRFGTADAYEGNLVVPPTGNGQQHGRHGGHAGQAAGPAATAAETAATAAETGATAGRATESAGTTPAAPDTTDSTSLFPRPLLLSLRVAVVNHRACPPTSAGPPITA